MNLAYGSLQSFRAKINVNLLSCKAGFTLSVNRASFRGMGGGGDEA